ncbi:DNA topoisomerase 2-binding protein 1 isoform X1 [Python bivittatus]|uniref:DNA topoisomerase 2-binding protein 1 isoform X1 n=1 Tax=Python bivittatus TaxID=176946 RepID=A0A9F5JBS7_PYTBI|nr:DNA topoisomerase 2-binding protein 1 isoform X1 [Python bivittatus]XP_025029631.1 DNA topoisomerase 2-binding protein 1 isoform X1 [Python bivittatus]XP_025029641.1 DNA topoisomerase 2-binding protein 1 isoform X1 [Python bivittatus]
MKGSKEPYFVKFIKTAESSEFFLQALESIKEFQSEECLQILEKEAALRIQENDKSLYICDQFSGVVFNHLQKLGCRIVGPQVVVYCMQNQRCVPKADHPVFNMTMADVTISCTSLPKETREEVHEYVQLMGGRIYRDLNVLVTHLIAGEVGSKKYLVAANLKKPILLPTWIKTLWDKSQHRIIRYTDINMGDFLCPPFLGCTICVTGLSSMDRQEVQRLTTENGGQYTGQLKMNECTHLIVQEPKGQKYECARRWNVHCISMQWFFDSIEKGFCQDESMYLMVPGTKQNSAPSTSTPTSQASKPDSRTLSDVSHISNINLSDINETSCSSVLNSRLDPPPDDLNNLNISSLQARDDLLDGCRIYLCGFSARKLDKMKKLINSGGAVRFNQLNEDVTHVIVGDCDDELKQFLKKTEQRPYAVTVQWLLECFRKGYLVPEEQYAPASYQQVNSPSSEPPFISKKNNVLKKEHVNTVQVIETDEDLLSQYVTHDSKVVHPDDHNEIDHTVFQDGKEVTVSSLAESSSVVEGALFSGRKFFLLGFGKDDESCIRTLIEENAGKVLLQENKAIADYAVVPLMGNKVASTVGDVVTNTWLVMCIEQQTLIDPQSSPLFTPVPMKEGATPLQQCVLSFSQFSGSERESLIYLASQLGARVQEFFVRRANPKKGMLVSTHLVLKEPDGSKYEAAKKWNLPAITMAWLLESARMGRKADESKFLIDNIDTKDKEKNFPSSLDDMETGTASSNTPDRPSSVLETGKITTVTPLDVNRFQSKAFQSVISQHIGKNPSSPVGSKVVQKEPSLHLDTPSKFLSKDKLFKPSFDVKDALAALETPGGPNQCKRKLSTPLSEVIGRNLKLALANSTRQTVAVTASPQLKAAPCQTEEAAKPLVDVVICVSKKLSKKQSELNTIAAFLGADYRWCFDETVTHFIYQGRQNDNSREYKSAKERGIYIVSEHWLLESAQEYKRLAESLYPHTYNPKMSLNISGVEDDRFSQRLDSAGKGGKEDKNNSLDDDTEKVIIDQINEAEQKEHESKGVLTQTLEMRENFQKQLQEIMTATSLAKLQGQRSSLSRNGFENSPTTPDGPRSMRNGRSRVLEALRQSRQVATDVNTEPSQNEQIIWDDPTAREERARLASNLQWPNSPSQYSEQIQAIAAPPGELSLRKSLSDTEIVEMGVNDSTKINSVEIASPLIRNPETPTREDHLIPTPLAPAIAFPLANPPVAPQPKEDVIKTDQGFYEEPRKLHRFQLSSLNPQERIDYYHLIEELGGVVLEKQCFDSSCTHTIVGHPLRNEKFLASMAAGKWVLHRSYLEACRAAQSFVEEEDYEWGSNSILSVLTGISVVQKKLAVAARRWRKTIQRRREETSTAEGAFGGWKVILNVDPAKESGFKRLLESGGAKVFPAHSPPHFREVTHLFADLNKLKPEDVRVNIGEAAAQGVNCLKPEYIADYLIQESPSPMENYHLPEAAAYLQNSKRLGTGFSQKRKAAEEMHTAKRSRIH